jgi:PPP family 3-phenylpropionic acid transporter
MGMSLYVSIGTGLPTLVGNMLGGIVIERLGYRALFGIFALVPLIALGVYVLFVLAKKNKRGYIV